MAQTLLNQSIWCDTNGLPIQAHGGGLLRVGDDWFWYGEDKSGATRQYVNAKGDSVARVDVVGVSGYRSRDLVNWEPMGVVLSSKPNATHHDLHPSQVMERPKVVFNHESGTFVMWLHMDRPDYSLAAAGVAIADRPEGPFHYLGSIRPQGRDCRDQTVFVDDDGSAYHFCSTDMNSTLLVTRLSDDYRALTGESKSLFVDRHMEAHAVTKAGGRYWYLASGCTGWDPNPARSAVADSIWGPWEELGNPCQGGDRPEMTWGAQSTFLQSLPDGQVLAMFDLWRPEALRDSGYVWVLADTSEEGFVLPWRDRWQGVGAPEVVGASR